MCSPCATVCDRRATGVQQTSDQASNWTGLGASAAHRCTPLHNTAHTAVRLHSGGRTPAGRLHTGCTAHEIVQVHALHNCVVPSSYTTYGGVVLLSKHKERPGTLPGRSLSGDTYPGYMRRSSRVGFDEGQAKGTGERYPYQVSVMPWLFNHRTRWWSGHARGEKCSSLLFNLRWWGMVLSLAVVGWAFYPSAVSLAMSVVVGGLVILAFN